MSKIQEEIENLKKELSKLNTREEEFYYDTKLSQTKKCVEIFKEILDNLQTKNIDDSGVDIQTGEYWVNVNELKSQLDEVRVK